LSDIQKSRLVRPGFPFDLQLYSPELKQQPFLPEKSDKIHYPERMNFLYIQTKHADVLFAIQLNPEFFLQVVFSFF